MLSGFSASVGFNTQPPKGGWLPYYQERAKTYSFNTQPPKGGWPDRAFFFPAHIVSTHSRLKAAGFAYF